MCLELARLSRGPLKRRGVEFAHLQTPWVIERLGISKEDPLRELVVIPSSGALLGGVDAIVYLMRRIWWAWPLWIAARLPIVNRLLWAAYRWIAARRHCLTGTCAAPNPTGNLGSGGRTMNWLPLAGLTALAIAFGPALPPWVFMWTLAVALFLGCKWLTWSRARREGADPGRLRSLGYLFLWVGMDPRPFFKTDHIAIAPGALDWASAWSKTLGGAALIWGGARLAFEIGPAWGGWTGMIGIAFMLHFGAFHLMALAWRRIGVDAKPIMRSPALATSLSEFWSERWNRAFNDLAHGLLFRPSMRRLGVTGATLLVFLASGLIHDLVISLPAGGGFGLPTLYFLLQGLAVLLVRSRVGKRWKLNRGALGWLTTALVTLGPVALLFHPPFIETVILPFLETLNAC